MKFAQDDGELVPLSDAVSRVYTEITGASISRLGGPVAEALLHEVAHAIADLATIYGATENKGPVRPVPAPRMKQAFFHSAATLLRTAQRVEYQRLYIRRGDVKSAVNALKRAGKRFPTIDEIQSDWTYRSRKRLLDAT